MIQINKRTSQSDIDKLDKLLSSSIELFDRQTPGHVVGFKNISKMEMNELLILQWLLDNTDFTNNFTQAKFSEYLKFDTRQGFLFGILSKMNSVPKEKQNAIYFLELLNNELDEIKKKPIKKYQIIVPLRMDIHLEKKHLSMLKKKLALLFGAKLLDTKKAYSHLPGLDSKTINKLQLIYRDSTFFMFQNEARNYYFAAERSYEQLENVLGVLFLAKFMGNEHTRWSSLSPTFEYARFKICEFPIVLENGKRLFPTDNELLGINPDEQHRKSDTLKIEESRYKLLNSFLNILLRKENNLKRCIIDALKLYYLACIEEDLQLSFLKFWIVLEIIGRKDVATDQKLLSRITSIVNDNTKKDFVLKLYRKRNSLVHKYQTSFISQYERNVAKILADDALYISFHSLYANMNIEEHYFRLEHSKLEQKDLRKRINILKKIMT